MKQRFETWVVPVLLLTGWATSAGQPGPPPVGTNDGVLMEQALQPTNKVLRLGTARLAPSGDGIQGPVASRYVFRPGTHRFWSAAEEAAEQANAQAMRHYRERWERHLRAPGTVPAPVLCPSWLQPRLPPPPPPPNLPERKPGL